MILVCICWLTKSILFFYKNHIASACVSLISLGFSIASVGIAIVIYRRQSIISDIRNGNEFVRNARKTISKSDKDIRKGLSNADRLPIDRAMYRIVKLYESFRREPSSKERAYIRLQLEPSLFRLNRRIHYSIFHTKHRSFSKYAYRVLYRKYKHAISNMGIPLIPLKPHEY